MDGGTLVGQRAFDVNDATLTVNGGTLSAPNGLTVHDGSTLNVNGGTITYETTLVGSTLNLGPFATSAAIFVCQGTCTLSGNIAAGQTVNVQGTLLLNSDAMTAGTLRVANGGRVSVNGSLTQTGGTLTLAGGTLETTTGLILQGGGLSGSGTINGDVSNGATITLGDPFTLGTLTIHGDYTQTADGRLNVKLAGVGASDQLVIGGAATLDGTLNVVLTGGYTPTTGDSFPVLTFASTDGSMFANVSGDGGLFTVNYDPTDVTLVAN